MYRTVCLLILGWVVLLSGCQNQDELKKHFSEAEKLAPKIYHCADEISQYKSELEAILIKAPGSSFAPEACYKLGKLNEVFGHHQAAIDYYQKLFSHYPESPRCAEGLFHIGQIYHYQLDQSEPANIAYQQVITLYPESPLLANALLEQALLWIQMEEWEKVIANYLQIKSAFPENPLIHDLTYRIAEIYDVKLKQPQLARTYYQALLDNYANNPWVEAAKFRLAQLEKEGVAHE